MDTVGDLVFEALVRDVCAAQYVSHGIYVQFKYVIVGGVVHS